MRFYIAFAAIVLLVVIFHHPDDSSKPAPADVNLSGGYRNVQWDGHLLIEWGKGDYSGGIIHHPDCPCREVRGELLPEK